jgi:cleavage and polyadenylation specificity factor subunit 1
VLLANPFFLQAITHSGDLFVYRSYSFTETATEFDCLPLRFRRIEHEVTLRKMDNYEDEFASLKRHKEKEYAICELNGKPSAAESTVPIATAAVKLENTMTVFNNLGPYSGVVVTGPVSYWIMFSSSGLHFHPLYVEKGMKCITFFRNAGCPNGFIYFTGENAMRLAQLPSNVQFNARWPLRKVILRTTPHFLAYHPPSKTFVVAVSSEQPNKYKARAVNDTTEPLELAQEDARFVYPLEHRFEVLLLTPATWEIIDRFALEEFEHISALKVVSLNSEEVIEGKKSFIAVSTIVSQGEDVTCKGKVHLFDIVEVVPEPGRPHTTRKLKLVYSKEQRGPVTSLSAVSGHLLSAIGQKIFAWAFVNGELIGKAFIDSDIYIHRLESVKEFVLSADIRSGISLLRYQESQKTMSLVSRDYDLADACAVSFVVDDFTLAFMVAHCSSH